MRLAAPLFVIAMLVGLSACSSKAQQSTESDASTPSREELAKKQRSSLKIKGLDRNQSAQRSVDGEVPASVLKRVRADLDSHINGKQAVLVRSQTVTWSDGSMGCPQPGMAYTQQVIDGYHVIYEVEGKVWDYRVNDRGGFMLCKNAVRRKLSTPVPSE